MEYIIDENMNKNIMLRNKKCILDSERPDVAQEEKFGSLLKDKNMKVFTNTRVVNYSTQSEIKCN